MSVTLFEMSETRKVGFSPCRKYRNWLLIVWDMDLPVAAFIGLNPSTADEFKDDPTIRRGKAFARKWGCGGLLMLNLAAYRATQPAEMKKAADPIGPENTIDFLKTMLAQCAGPHVACWGRHGVFLNRGKQVAAAIPGLQCFGKNADGTPKHPLYLAGDTELEAL